MKVNALCTRTIFHAGKLYEACKVYSVVPVPVLGNYFAFEPALRLELRTAYAKQYNKSLPVAAKTAANDAKELADIAHAKVVVKDEPQTFYEMAPKPVVENNGKPLALSQLDSPADTGADFLG